jgi:hypothetical protein
MATRPRRGNPILDALDDSIEKSHEDKAYRASIGKLSEQLKFGDILKAGFSLASFDQAISRPPSDNDLRIVRIGREIMRTKGGRKK